MPDIFATPTPVSTSVTSPSIDIFAPTPASTMMNKTNEYEQKANAETDPDLKIKLNNVADAAANTLQRKPFDLFAPANPAVQPPEAKTFPELPMPGMFGATDLAKPAPKSNFVSDVTDVAKSLAGIPASLLSLFSSILPPMPPGTMQEQGNEAWQQIGKNTEEFATNVQAKPGETLRGAAGTVLGGQGLHDLFATGDPTELEAHPTKTALTALLNIPAVRLPLYGAAATALTKTRPILEGTAGGSKILQGADWLGSKVVSKYNWTPEMYRIEGEKAGREFLATVGPGGSKEMAMKTGELYAQNPKTMPFITPDTWLSPTNLKAVNEGYIEHTTRQVPGEFHFNQGGLNIVVDKQGFMRSGTVDEFNALSVDEQRKVFNIRAPMDANHQLMGERGLLTPNEQMAGGLGYYHKSYNLYHNQADWVNQLKTDPTLAPVLDRARTFIAKDLKDPFNPTMPATTEQVQAKLDAMLQSYKTVHDNIATIRSPLGSATQALLTRTNMPKPIADLLGQMEGKYTPVRVGETLDYQNRILLFDQMATSMTKELARDGRPLLIQNPPGTELAPAMTGTGKPYVTMKAGNSPIWTDKWKDMQVHPDVVDALHTIGNPIMTGSLAKAFQAWKALHVADNLPSHINHSFGDVGFSHYAGASQLNPANWPFYSQAFKEIGQFWLNESTNPSPGLIDAMRAGAIRPGFASAEAGADYAKVMNPGQSITFEQKFAAALNSKTQSQTSSLYDMERQWARYGTYLKLKNDGLSSMEAATEVNKWYPTYDTSSPIGNFLRGRGDIGPLSSTVGQIIGGPFTSFQMEAVRIALLAAKEHPIRFATFNMVPLTLTTLGMGASGLTMADYHDMIEHQADYRKGKLLIPIPDKLVGGEPRFVNWTHMMPLAEYQTHTSVGGYKIPMAIGPGMLASGPGWSLINMLDNYNPHTGGKFYDPSRGDGAGKWMEAALQQFILPQSVYDLYHRSKAALGGVQASQMEHEPQSLGWAAPQAFIPQAFNSLTLEDLNKEGRMSRRGELKGEKAGFKSIGKSKTLSESEKEANRLRLFESVQQSQER